MGADAQAVNVLPLVDQGDDGLLVDVVAGYDHALLEPRQVFPKEKKENKERNNDEIFPCVKQQ